MKKPLSLLVLLSACVAVADVLVGNSGSSLGSVREINCRADAGLLCARTPNSYIGDVFCNAANATAPGCVVPSAQTFAGNKTFTGTVATPLIDAGIAAIGNLDVRNSSINNTAGGTALLVTSSAVDGTVGTTVAATTLKCASNTLISTDLCLDVQNSSNTSLLNVQSGGSVSFSSLVTNAGQSIGSAGTDFNAAIGAGAGGNVSTAGGVGGAFNVAAGTGGPAGTSAGQGGQVSLAAGAGGADNGSVVGGHGGNSTLKGGAAGAGNVGGTANLVGGAGGAASSSHTASAGGQATVSGGIGGASASGGAASAGGAVFITGGLGGIDTVNYGPGAGGAVTIKSGNGGIVGSGSGASAGAVVLDTGTSSGGATAGTLSIGATNAGAMTIGRTGQQMTLPGIVNSTNTLDTTGSVAFGTNGTSFTSSKSVSTSIDFSNISAQTCQDQTISGLTDCTTGDPVFCALPSTLEAGLAGSCFMSASATVTIRLCNVTSGGINPAAQGFGARCFH